MINAIIFDFFGVIDSEVATRWLDGYFQKKENTHLKDEYFRPFDLGEIDERQLFEQLSHLSHHPPKEIKKEFADLVIVDPRMVALIKKLKSEYKIGLCSNGNSVFVRRILKQYDLEKLFDHIIISGECGVVKPDKKIYNITLKKLNSKAQDAIFIDDSPKNIKGAQKVGLKTILFEDYTKFIKELNNFKLI